MKIPPERKAKFCSTELDPVNQFLPLLVGSELMLGIPAMEVAAYYGSPAEQVKFLLKAGHLVGSPEHWTISSSVWKAVAEKLAVARREGPPAVSVLLKAYKERLAGIPRECQPATNHRALVFMRHLARQVSPEVILTAIPVFFEKQMASEKPDLTLQNFGKHVSRMITKIGDSSKSPKRNSVRHNNGLKGMS